MAPASGGDLLWTIDDTGGSGRRVVISVRTRATSTVEELTVEEAWEIFDSEAQRTVGMSGAEFKDRWDRGELVDSDDPNVTRVAMLLPGAW